MKPELIKKYLEHLKNNLNNNSKEKSLFNYIEKYWVNIRGYESFNYYNIINEETNSIKIKYLFLTNNIIESFHGKISNYLPKGITTIKGFSLSITKILKDSILTKKEIQRHDYKTRTLISIAKKFNLNGDFKWFTYKEYKNMEINLIKNSNNNNIKKEEIDEFILNINGILDEEIEDLNNPDNIIENNGLIENQSNYEESESQDESDFNNDIIDDLNENKELEFNVIDNLNKINKEKDIMSELSDNIELREEKKFENKDNQDKKFNEEIKPNMGKRKRNYNELKRDKNFAEIKQDFSKKKGLNIQKIVKNI